MDEVQAVAWLNVTKVANFWLAKVQLVLMLLFWYVGGVIDFNKVLNDNWACALVGVKSQIPIVLARE